MAQLALNGIFSFSSVPLYIAAYFGFILSMASFLYAIYAVYIKTVKNISIPGWASVLVMIIFFGGIQLIFLGVMGAYIGRIYEENKGRPLYVVKNKVGF